jgi:hypothetical protein
MVGLRGVGKTVLLDRMRDDAEATGIHAVRIEAPEGRSLPALRAAASPGPASPQPKCQRQGSCDAGVGGLCQDVERATATSIAALDESFFRVHFDRLTPAEKKYLRAMAQLGPGPHRSGDIADCLDRKVTALGPTRNQLIAKGMIWSPNHGDTAFTVPLFDEFMRRIMPGDDWR